MVLGLGKQTYLPCAKALLPPSPNLRPAVPRLLTLSRNAPYFVNVTFFAFAQSHTANLPFLPQRRVFPQRLPLFHMHIREITPAFLCGLKLSLCPQVFSL